MSRFTHPLIEYSRAARNGSGSLRTVVGVALVCVFVFVFVKVARLGMARALLGTGDSAVLGEARDLASPLGVLLTLGVFLAVWLALWVVVPIVHHRPAKTLFGPEKQINWTHFRFGLAISLLVGAAAWTPLMMQHGEAFSMFPNVREWMLLMVLAGPLIFVQCAAEELLFRGYLLQQLAARSLSVLGWSVLPSLLFALAHPSEEGWLGMSYFHFVFGLIMAAVTSRTANLGAAIGLHFGNNLVNILLIAPAQLVSGLALFSVPESVDTLGPRIAYLVMMFIGAALFMGFMDYRFVRQWRASKQADRDRKLAEQAEIMRGTWPRPGAGPVAAE